MVLAINNNDNTIISHIGVKERSEAIATLERLNEEISD
jgi:hypothetical protein